MSTPLVYTLEDLAEHTSNAQGRIGLWGFHNKMHDGHRAIADATADKSDFVVGLYWCNLAKLFHAIFPQTVVKDDPPPLDSDIKELCDRCDVVMVWQGDYIPFGNVDRLWGRMLDELPAKEIPGFILRDPHNAGSLRASQALKIVMNDHFHHHYSVGGFRDAWRYYYSLWQNKMYDYDYEIIDVVSDHWGNNLSSRKHRLPEELQQRIDRKLIRQGTTSIHQVFENCGDIEGLKIQSFFRDPNTNYMYGRFQFYNDPSWWWVEGIKDGDPSS